MSKVKFANRSTYSCSAKMKFVEYSGYYESFKY